MKFFTWCTVKLNKTFVNLGWILILGLSISAKAGNFSTISNGDFTNDAVWDAAPPDNSCAPNGNHTYNISDSIWTNCATPLSFTGSVTINVLNGGIFYIAGNGGVSGNVTLNISNGGKVVITGNFSIGGSSNTNVNGNLVVKGNISGSATFDCNGSSNTGTVTIGGTGCSSCSSGATGCSQNIPLTVDFKSFTAVYNYENESTSLTWETSHEINNNYFQIEKTFDGVKFEILAKIPGVGNSLTTQKYQYEDKSISNSGIVYYRIKQVDSDGHYTYSKLILVNKKVENIEMRIMPNPAEGNNFSISISNENASPIMVAVYDFYGRLLFAKTMLIEDSKVIYSSDIKTELTPGIYYICASNDENKINKRLIIR